MPIVAQVLDHVHRPACFVQSHAHEWLFSYCKQWNAIPTDMAITSARFVHAHQLWNWMSSRWVIFGVHTKLWINNGMYWCPTQTLSTARWSPVAVTTSQTIFTLYACRTLLRRWWACHCHELSLSRHPYYPKLTEVFPHPAVLWEGVVSPPVTTRIAWSAYNYSINHTGACTSCWSHDLQPMRYS